MQGDDAAPATVRFETKVALVLRPDLAPWQKAHDEANRAAVKAVPRDQLNLVGIGVYGPRGAVDKALKNVRLDS
ncbi:MAG: DUF2000 family protein [Candidatus Dormiibacterota bacterium]